MKTVKIILTAALALLIACSGGSSKKGGEIRLKLKLEEGQTYLLNYDLDMLTKVSAEGMDMETRQNMNFLYKFLVDNVDDNGIMEISAIFEKVKFKQTGGGMVLEYDSEKPDTSADIINKVYSAILGSELKIKIKPDGSIVDMQGVTALREKMKSALDGIGVPGAEQYMDEMLKNFSDESFKGQFQGAFKIYPEKPVVAGDKWATAVKMNMGFPIKLENTWELKERKNGIAFIGVQSEINKGGGISQMEFSGIKFDMNLAGSQKGNLEMDEDSGWINKLEMNQELKGEMSTEVDGQEMKIPLSTKAKIVYSSDLK